MSIQQRTLSTICVLFLLIFPATRAPAVIVAFDDFTYTDGLLYGANGGTGWISIWSGTAMLVSNNEAIGADTVTDPKYGSRTFDNPETTPELFVAFDLRVPASFELNDYWALYLSLGVNFSNLVVGKAPGSNEFLVGNTGYTYSGITIQPGITYHIVAAYDMDPDLLTLWVNPDGADYYVPATGANSADASHIENAPFHMSRVDFATNTRLGFAVDNILVGNTPESVGLLSTSPCACLGDMNVDGRHNGLDTQQFVDCLIAGGNCACADLDGGGVTMNDLAIFLDDLLAGTTCP